MTAEDTLNETLQKAIEIHVAVLMEHWPNGMRNVISHNVRLFFNAGQKLCVGAPGQTSSEALFLDVATLAKGDKKAELLCALSSYLWKRLGNTGSGVQMPNVELPSGRKTTTLPPMGRPMIGFTDPRNPNTTVDMPEQLGPGTERDHIGGGQSRQLPPGKK
jgi:hypothetical protein